MKQVINLSYLSKKYGPGYVALSKKSGRVMTAGKTLEEAWKKAEKKA